MQLEIEGEDDAGDTAYRTTLEARIKELGLENEVTLLGAIDADAVKSKLLNTHLFVPPKSPKILAETILDLSQNKGELDRLSQAGRPHIVAHYRAALGAETLIKGHVETTP